MLAAVESQYAPWKYQVIVVDSGSTDGSLEYVKTLKNINLIEIPNSEFQHGRTRNLAIEQSSGEFVAFLTQDAIPATKYWLYDLVVVLENNVAAAGVYGRHIAHDDANLYTTREMENHFSNLEKLPLFLSKYTDHEKYCDDLSWKLSLSFYSDNNSCLRKSVWMQIPYREVKYGEDQLWARDIIDNGYSKAYSCLLYTSDAADE